MAFAANFFHVGQVTGLVAINNNLEFVLKQTFLATSVIPANIKTLSNAFCASTYPLDGVVMTIPVKRFDDISRGWNNAVPNATND